MSEQRTPDELIVHKASSERKRIPKWAYVLAVLVGPAAFFGGIWILMAALNFLFDLLARFDYWWVVCIVVVYLIVGGILAGLLSTVERSTDG
jgi:hypothetical protein